VSTDEASYSSEIIVDVAVDSVVVVACLVALSLSLFDVCCYSPRSVHSYFFTSYYCNYNAWYL